ncbi:MAG: hypothetical protein NVS1B4_03080 [Gemmatimonadaceae bacterium]
MRPLSAQAGPNAWRDFASGFVGSIFLHEVGHVAASFALGSRPSFGFEVGRPTIYSGIDAEREPRRQFVFSSAGLLVQTLVDEAVLDVPHGGHIPATPVRRGLLAGGLATTLFYITLGRNASVSDIEYMSRTSSLSKDQLSLIFGGMAAVHALRVAGDDRFPRFFVRPADGRLRIGAELSPH